MGQKLVRAWFIECRDEVLDHLIVCEILRLEHLQHVLALRHLHALPRRWRPTFTQLSSRLPDH
jgi:hypothetical protein